MIANILTPYISVQQTTEGLIYLLGDAIERVITLLIIILVIKLIIWFFNFTMPFNIAIIRQKTNENTKEIQEINKKLETLTSQNEQLIKLNLENIELQKIISNKFKDKD